MRFEFAIDCDTCQQPLLVPPQPDVTVELDRLGRYPTECRGHFYDKDGSALDLYKIVEAQGWFYDIRGDGDGKTGHWLCGVCHKGAA